MKSITLSCFLTYLFVGAIVSAKTISIQNNEKQDLISQEKQTEVLDSEGRYVLSWEINDNVITFEVEADTLGFVGLGISPAGNMAGADLFIAGVNAASEPYSGDYHALANGPPTLDDHQDWELVEARENSTHTYIKVTRLLNTCDEQDYQISEENTARVIFSMGATDEILGHGPNRGTKSINLINFPEPDVDFDKLETWSVLKNMTMPINDTTYWCTIHRGPTLTEKHHVVGFDVFLDGLNATQHTHHFILSKCTAPPGSTAEETFAPFLEHPGEFCYIDDKVLPSDNCGKYLFVWAVGGKRTMFPLDAGYAIDDNPEDAFYMLEGHYDNPRMLEGVQIHSGLNIYHTNELRKYDAELLAVGHDTVPTLLIPPNQTEYVIAGHCSHECTNATFPETGLQVFNILLHSHLSGRKLKLRLFRDGVELPWMSFDDTYDFDFQQNKALRNEITILRGDQITYECTYDSTWNNGKVVLGGLSSREEMCLAFLWVYSTDPDDQPTVNICGGSYSFNDTAEDYGITNFTMDPTHGIIIVEPEEYNGMRFEDYLNHNFSWTAEFIAAQQEKVRYAELDGMCCARGTGCGDLNPIGYPDIDSAYVPKDECSAMVSEATTVSGQTEASEPTTVGYPITTDGAQTRMGSFAILILMLISANLI